MRTHTGLLILAFAAFTAAPAAAQTQKGRIITDVDFELDVGTSTFDGSGMKVDHNNLGTSIMLGYTFIEDVEFGGFLGVNRSNIKIGNTTESSSNNAMYGIFVRHYLLQGQGLRPFVSGAGGLGSMTTGNTGSPDTKHSMSFYSGTVGLAYFVNAHVGVHVQGEYVRTSFTENDNHPASQDMSAKAFQFSIGTVVSF